jgi:hypothetical protein
VEPAKTTVKERGLLPVNYLSGFASVFFGNKKGNRTRDENIIFGTGSLTSRNQKLHRRILLTYSYTCLYRYMCRFIFRFHDLSFIETGILRLKMSIHFKPHNSFSIVNNRKLFTIEK